MSVEKEALKLIERFRGYAAECGGYVRLASDEKALKFAIICAQTVIEDLTDHDYPMYESGLMATCHWDDILTYLKSL